MTDVLELETRRKIYDFITKNPGANLSDVAKMLRLSVQLVDYHLFYMEQHELITIVKEGGYKRCYIKGKIGIKDKKILSLLRQETLLKIMLFLLKHPYSRHRDILKHLGMSSPRFSYHLRKLVKNKIIKEHTVGGKTGYILCNEKEVVVFLIKYRPTSIAKMVKDTWEEFGPG